jgi:hypothetical protein
VLNVKNCSYDVLTVQRKQGSEMACSHSGRGVA